MNLFTKSISLLIAIQFIGIGLGAQLTPFECDGTFYLSQYEWNNPQNGSDLYSIQTQPNIEFIEVASYSFPINGIGYNQIDGFIYAINPFNQNIYRIGKEGGFENLGHPSGMQDLSRAQSSGDISPDGEYVITGKEKYIVRLDVECDEANVISQKVKKYTTNDSGTPTFGDIIYQPKTGKCYGYEKNTRQMAEIDAETGLVTPFGVINNVNNIGALFWGENNELYGYNDNDLYKIDLNNGKVDNVDSGPNSSSRDGCSCQVIEITKSVDLNSDLNHCDSLFKLSFNTQGLENISSIQWFLDGNLIPNEDSTYHTSEAGTYVVTVVNQKYICRSQSTIYSDTIEVDPITPLEISSESIIQPGCINETGEVIVSASGGISPYEFSLDGVNFSAENQFSQLNIGQHTFYLKDSLGCIDSLSLSLTTDNNPVISSLNTEDTKCALNNGSISVEISSGIPPFLYSINGASFTDQSVYNSLAPGDYTIIIKDAKGCLDTASTVITPSTSVSIDSLLSSSPYCDTSLNNIDVYASSQNGNIQYSINNSTFNSSTSYDSLTSGLYTIIAQDEEGCKDTSAISLNYQAFNVNINKFNLGCKDSLGVIDFNAEGGHPPYEYSIDDGNSFMENPTFDGLSVGTYNLIAQDSFGCQLRDTISIQSQNPLELSTSVKNTRCNLDNGEVVFSVDNTTGNYSLSIDSMHIENSPITGLSDGVHFISVIDSIGCEVSDSIFIEPSLPLDVDSSIAKAEYCNLMNGKIEVHASSDTTPIYYTFNDSLEKNNGSFTDLNSGDYTITM